MLLYQFHNFFATQIQHICHIKINKLSQDSSLKISILNPVVPDIKHHASKVAPQTGNALSFKQSKVTSGQQAVFDLCPDAIKEQIWVTLCIKSGEISSQMDFSSSPTSHHVHIHIFYGDVKSVQVPVVVVIVVIVIVIVVVVTEKKNV